MRRARLLACAALVLVGCGARMIGEGGGGSASRGTASGSNAGSPGADGARRVELAEEPRFDFSHELTVAAWVKPEASSVAGAIVGKWYAKDSFLLGVRQVTGGDGLPSLRYAFSIAEPEGDWGRPTDAISPTAVEL